MSQIESRLIVKGMTCSGCEKAVERALLALAGVVSAQVSRSEDSVLVRFEADQVEPAQLKQVIQNAGYTVL